MNILQQLEAYGEIQELGVKVSVIKSLLVIGLIHAVDTEFLELGIHTTLPLSGGLAWYVGLHNGVVIA